jgi:hypothetical protein
MPRRRSADPDLPNKVILPRSDPCAEDTPVVSLEALLRRTPLLKAVVLPQPARSHPGETPILGEGAIDRWLALHDRARELRAALRPGDSVGERHVQRAIRSQFLYEHVITPKTRWQARSRLWERDHLEKLPAFVEQLRWTQCRCARCQPEASSPQPVGQHPWSGTRSA